MPEPTAAPRQISAGASLSPPDGGKGGLPLAVSTFVGREREAAEVMSLVRDCHLVTLTGPAGMGKSRLALEVATRLAAGYPGGGFFVELAPLVDPSHMAPAVASALGLPHEPGRPFVETLADHVRRRPLLLVLDNCEHLLEPCAALVEDMLVACPELTVLATSQQALDVPGEQVRQLDPLSLPGADVTAADAAASEAVALFVDRARASRPDFVPDERTLPAVGEICRRVDGIPLAIELAAGRVSAFSVDELAQRLDRRFQLLDRGTRTAPTRHQTLAAAFQWSYELLAPPEATLLRRLSVFAGGATLEAVEAVCAGGEVPRRDAAELLASLVAKSLVVSDHGQPRPRFRMLETLRAYAGDRLAETEEHDAVHRRLVAWCVAVAEQAWRHLSQGDHSRRLAASEPDQDNVRAALRWALSHDESTLALRLAAAMTPMWKGAGHLGEGRQWLEQAVEAGGEGLAALRARALWGVGLLATLQGDMDAARVALSKSLALAREGGSQRGAVEALNLLGFVAVFTQDPHAALPALEESVAIARHVGDPSAVTNPLSLCGRAHLFLGHVATARRIFEECLELAHGAGTTGGDLLMGLGWTMLAQGQHARAEEVLDQALQLLQASEERFELALALSFVAELAWTRGDHDATRAAVTQGLAHARAMSAPFPLARCLQTMGRLAHAEGDAEAARRWLDEAVAAARQSALPWALVRCLHARSEISEALGDHEEATSLVEEALALAREKADKEGTASSLYLLGRLARSGGDLHQAASLHREALTLYGEVGDAAGVARCGEALAGVLVAHGALVAAARLLGAAQTLRHDNGSRRLPGELPGHQADVERLRAGLAAADLQQAWAEGGSRSVEDVVASIDWASYRPSHGWAALSEREREVADLISRGLTYAEVGERLFISPRTVQGHLSKVFTKLGVSSRRELRELARPSP